MTTVFGTRTMRTVSARVFFECDYCGVGARQRVVRQETMGIIFFIPLLLLRTSYVNECSHCHGLTPITAYQASHAIDWARTHANASDVDPDRGAGHVL